MQVVVLVDELLQLSLNIGNLLLREAVLIERDLCRFQESQETKLSREEEEQRLASLARSSCSTDSVDVVSWVIWWIKLDDPVYCRNIQTSRSNVCTQENTSRSVAEFKESVCTFLLLLLSVQIKYWDVDVVEQLSVILYAIATTEEDNHLFLQVLL